MSNRTQDLKTIVAEIPEARQAYLVDMALDYFSHGANPFATEALKKHGVTVAECEWLSAKIADSLEQELWFYDDVFRDYESDFEEEEKT